MGRRAVRAATIDAGCFLSVGTAGATLNCVYTGAGCSAGYPATGDFPRISSSLLKVVVRNTSTIDASITPNNSLYSSSFPGASPIPGVSDSAGSSYCTTDADPGWPGINQSALSFVSSHKEGDASCDPTNNFTTDQATPGQKSLARPARPGLRSRHEAAVGPVIRAMSAHAS